MLKIGLIGLGFMGRGHLSNYVKLEAEGFPVKLTSVCDVDPEKFTLARINGNLEVGDAPSDMAQYALYTDMEEMLNQEDLDCVDIALPTYLHAKAAIMALNKGVHVLCEKPMALTGADCAAMIDASERSGKKLMTAQCLRFWPEYEYLKDTVATSRYGKVLGAYFYRGGGTPKWSYENWLLTKERSGGCLLDQHVHDVDMINWLFGKPEKVSTIGRNVIEGSGYDVVSTQYSYADGKVVNAQDDWMLNGDYGFEMLYRISFEKGNLIYQGGKLKVNPHDGEGFEPELPKEDGYYREMKYFFNAVMEDTPIEIAAPDSTRDTILIAEAEQRSADLGGAPTTIS